MNSLKFLLNLNSPDLQPDITVNVMGKSCFYTVNTCVCNLKMADEDNHTNWPLKESLKTRVMSHLNEYKLQKSVKLKFLLQVLGNDPVN